MAEKLKLYKINHIAEFIEFKYPSPNNAKVLKTIMKILDKTNVFSLDDNIYIDESDMVLKKLLLSFNINFKGMTVGPPIEGGLVFKQPGNGEEKIKVYEKMGVPKTEYTVYNTVDEVSK